MNWITNLINKKIPEGENKKDIPNGLWLTCPGCNTLLFKKDLAKNNVVCASCDHYFYLPAEKRLELLFNDGKYLKLKLPNGLNDPLKFKGKEKYSAKLKQNREKTGQIDSIIAGYGKIGLVNSIVAVMNFEFMGGSMGTYFGEGFVHAAEEAIKKKCPFIVVTSSGGARMQEGVFSLMQMPKTTVAVEKVKDAGLPYIVILVNPTTGGVTASFAMLGDIHIAEQGATIAFTGARVIEQTIRKKLPQGFQTSEYLLDHGMVDIVEPRHKIKDTLANILNLIINK